MKGVWIAADGKTGLATDGDTLVRLDIETNRGEVVAKLGKRLTQDCVFTPDGKTVFACDFGKLQAWETATGTPRGEYTATKTQLFWKLAVSSDGAFVVAGGGGQVVVWNVTNPIDARTVAVESGNVQALAFAPGGTQLAAGISRANAPLQLVEIERPKPEKERAEGESPSDR